MATDYNPSIVTDNIVFCLDAANTKSYPGSGTTWIDMSGKNHDGTLTNGPTFSSDNSGSIVFDGSNDYTAISASGDFSFAGDFTIESWVYPTSSVVFANILSTENFDFKLQYLAVRIYTTSGSNSSATATLNKWNHILYYRRSGTMYTNINGVENTVTPAAFTGDGSSGAEVGRKIRSSNENFIGRISNVKVYKDKALTKSEILQNYNALKGRFGL